MSKKSKKYFLKLCLFLVIYTFLARYNHIIFGKIYGFNFNINEHAYYLITYPLLMLFSYIRREKISQFSEWDEKIKTRIINLLIACAFFASPLQIVYKFTDQLLLSYYIPFYLGTIFLFTAIFGRNFIRQFKDESFIILTVLSSLMISSVLIGRFWESFSYLISFVLKYTLPLIEKTTVVDLSTFEVSMLNFSVDVGAPCAGVYSLVSFGALFIAAAYMMKKAGAKINNTKFSIALVSGFCLIFILNIFRVATIITVGALYSPQLALDLFHQYMGAVILLVVLMIYLYLVMPLIVERSKGSNLQLQHGHH